MHYHRSTMNDWLDIIAATNTIAELERVYYDGVLPYYGANEWRTISWEEAAVEYHDRTADHCGFTAIMHSARRWEALEAAGGYYHAA